MQQEEETIELELPEGEVDIREADLALGKLSTSSPVGQALMDSLVGDEVSVAVPRGTVAYKVERIAR